MGDSKPRLTQLPRNLRSASFPSHGVVAQLVRASACHAEGRGFESRPSRHPSLLLELRMAQPSRSGSRSEGWRPPKRSDVGGPKRRQQRAATRGRSDHPPFLVFASLVKLHPSFPTDAVYYVYRIVSEKEADRRYIGFTEDPRQRLADHNSGCNPSTRD